MLQVINFSIANVQMLSIQGFLSLATITLAKGKTLHEWAKVRANYLSFSLARKVRKSNFSYCKQCLVQTEDCNLVKRPTASIPEPVYNGCFKCISCEQQIPMLLNSERPIQKYAKVGKLDSTIERTTTLRYETEISSNSVKGFSLFRCSKDLKELCL